MKPIPTLLLAIAAATVSPGCGKDSTGPGGDVGTMSFTYSGAISGTFSANGSYQAIFGSGQQAGSAAVGFRHPGTGEFGVNGFEITSGTRGNMTVMIFEGTEKGRYTAGARTECEPRCATVILYFDVDMAGGVRVPGATTRAFLLRTGEIDVTELGSRVIKGTFSGTAVEQLGTAELTITNGTFSAPVMAGLPPQ